MATGRLAASGPLTRALRAVTRNHPGAFAALDNDIRHIEIHYWQELAKSTLETESKDLEKVEQKNWSDTLKTEIIQGTAWGHKITRVMEARQHKPVEPSEGPSLAVQHMLEDQTWATWWKDREDQFRPKILDLWGTALRAPLSEVQLRKAGQKFATLHVACRPLVSETFRSSQSRRSGPAWFAVEGRVNLW